MFIPGQQLTAAELNALATALGLSWTGPIPPTVMPVVPANLGISNVSSAAPATPFAGQVWINTSS